MGGSTSFSPTFSNTAIVCFGVGPFADSWLPDLLLIAGSPELKAFFKPIIVGLSALRPAEGRMPPLMEKKQDERYGKTKEIAKGKK